MTTISGVGNAAGGRSPETVAAAFRHDVMVRRNVLFGRRVARLLGLPVAERETYAWGVHFADLREPVDDDILRKAVRDLARVEGAPTRSELRRYLGEAELRAHLDLVAERRRRGERERRPLWL